MTSSFGFSIKRAIQSFERVLEIDPDKATFHANIGEVLTAFYRFKEAKKYLEYAAHLAQLENDDDLILTIDENLEALTETKKNCEQS